MKITINNQASLPNKYIRFIRWNLLKLQGKFSHLLYAVVFLNAEGRTNKSYSVIVKLGVQGHDLIIKHQSTDLGEIFKKITSASHRSLAQNKSKQKMRRVVL